MGTRGSGGIGDRWRARYARDGHRSWTTGPGAGNPGEDSCRVRFKRGRKKKLIVAFHFLRSDSAGWKCDQCRRQSLERKRRCGFLSESERGTPRVIWARGRTSTQECPKSLVTPGSIALVESFCAWK